MMSKINKKLKRIDLEMNNKKNADITSVAFQGIAGGEQGHTLAQWLADKFNHNFDEYDSAIDSVYNQTHVGGSAYHHLLDGQHSIWGAFKSVQDVSINDSWAAEIGQTTEHLIRDMTSVSGVNPFFSLSPAQFDILGSIVSNVGISKEFFADALTINGPELLGGSVALISSIMIGKKVEPERLSFFAGGCLISSLISANTMFMPIAASSMIYAVYKCNDRKQLLTQAGKGSLVSGSALLCSSLVGEPVWLGCIAGFMAAIAISKCIEKPEKAFEYSKQIVAPAKNIFENVAFKLKYRAA
ncbi:MAG: hypothetical protein E3K32_13710 [wastewater metagenome]|nr:hypothetical protein [Candidatus Loosdrechtia aerotolerans]